MAYSKKATAERILSSDKRMKELWLRSKLGWLNTKLTETESLTMDYMRVGGYQATEFVHCLIGERENIKYRLKEIHDKLYGQST